MIHGIRLKANALLWRALAPVTITLFHKLIYFHRRDTTWKNTSWMGVPVQQIPFDLWVKQEIIFETRPDLIIETGTFDGGSAYYYAGLFDILGGQGEIISIDIEPQENLPEHHRIEYVKASSIVPEVIERLREKAAGKRVMVVLDSDHSEKHVRKELEVLSEFVTPGCFLIVEDTNVYGHPVLREHGRGPMEALNDWLKTRPPFELDKAREKYMITFHPRGHWRRV
ncbi:CmcI family methyltransferase [soil metagenome]